MSSFDPSRNEIPAPLQKWLPENAVTITYRHRVGFFETDGMGIVHHSNYLRFCENARVVWLEVHDRPYSEYMEMELHFAVTHAQLDYRQSARFDDEVDVITWLEWIKGASLAMAYVIACGENVLATGRTEHATVNLDGRVRRIPKENRARLARYATSDA
ncbi:MAG: acyl-CoA thioesterase [Myxococcota bacterium]